MGMPFSGYETFQKCVIAQKKKGKNDESARKICGALQKRTEHKMREETKWETIEVV